MSKYRVLSGPYLDTFPNMNSLTIGWDSIKRAETPCFYCGPLTQKENERKVYKREKKHENG